MYCQVAGHFVLIYILRLIFQSLDGVSGIDGKLYADNRA